MVCEHSMITVRSAQCRGSEMLSTSVGCSTSSLIQAAVGLLHFCNENVAGAAKLYRSSREYMLRYGSPFLGLNQDAFWGQMDRCFAELMAQPAPSREVTIKEELIPTIELNPAPAAWPDPAPFLDEEHG